MKKLILIAFSLSAFWLYGQKTEEKIIDDNTIKSIVIEGDAIFKIDVTSISLKNIKITSKIEGEFTNSTKVLTQIKDGVLLITCDLPKFTNITDDKLNAHKVHSIEISLTIPKHLSLIIKSDIASAKITGTYNYLLLELNQGNAQVLNFIGNATINTLNGNINLETNNAIIEAKTKYGLLKKAKIAEANKHIKINSINGNINISKTKK